LARSHGLPFYVAAPTSTIDLAMPEGGQIPLEERNAREVTHFGRSQLTPDGVNIRNLTFDVTPHQYVSAIITERGVCRPPYTDSLRRVVEDIRSEGSL
jgi:methylthioribose-1-phosphate isomerase